MLTTLFYYSENQQSIDALKRKLFRRSRLKNRKAVHQPRCNRTVSRVVPEDVLVSIYIEITEAGDGPIRHSTTRNVSARRIDNNLWNDGSNGTEVFRVARDYALKTLRKTLDQDICDGSLAPMACPLLCNVVRPQLIRCSGIH
jgi:hypothetical protein